MPAKVARFFGWIAGYVCAIVGWLFIVTIVRNMADDPFSGWALVWILATGLAGMVGSFIYLYSLKGVDQRFRDRRTRWIGWGGMFFLSLQPNRLALVLVPVVLLAIPTLFLRETEAAPPSKSTA